MIVVKFVLFWVLTLYLWALVGRIIVEMIQSFSRQFRPPRWFALIAEPLFVVTDPPVKLLRRLIPPLPLGQVALDVSVLILFFILNILIVLVNSIPV